MYQNKRFIDVSESVCKSGSSKKMFHVRRICLPTDRRGVLESDARVSRRGGALRKCEKFGCRPGTHRRTISILILAINFCLHFTPVWHKIALLKRRLARFARGTGSDGRQRDRRGHARRPLSTFLLSRINALFVVFVRFLFRPVVCLEVVALERGVKARVPSSPDELLTRYVWRINRQRYLLILSSKRSLTLWHKLSRTSRCPTPFNLILELNLSSQIFRLNIVTWLFPVVLKMVTTFLKCFISSV